MLTEEDKQRIREEEIFRAEVQKSLVQLTSPKPSYQHLWAFFNTSLGIWVLSTVFLGIIGWTYAQWQASRQNTEQINKLDIEIDARLHAAEDTLNSQLFRKKEDSPIYVANVLLLPPMGERMILPEYANRNMRSLMYELLARLPLEEQGAVMMTLPDLQAIENQYLNKELNRDQVAEVRAKLNIFQNSRWKWDKMMQRQMAAYNYPYTLMMRLLVFITFFGLLFLTSWMFYIARQKNTPEPTSVQEAQPKGKEDSDQDIAVKVQTDNP